MMLKKTTVILLTGLALGVAPAAADSISNATMVALTMIGGGGLLSIGCMATALQTQYDEDDRENYDRPGFYVALSASYARENFSDSSVVGLVDGEIQESLQGFRGTPVGDPDALPVPIPPGDPGLYTFSLDDIADGDTFGVSGRGGYRCHPYVSTELQFESLGNFKAAIAENDNITNEGIDPADFDTPRKFDHRLESLVFTTNVKGYFLTGRYQPFVLVGVGFMRMESKVRDAVGGLKPGLAPHVSERIVDLAMRYGGGLDFYLTSNVVVSAEVSYLMPTGKLDNLDYYSIGLGLQYRF